MFQRNLKRAVKLPAKPKGKLSRTRFEVAKCFSETNWGLRPAKSSGLLDRASSKCGVVFHRKTRENGGRQAESER